MIREATVYAAFVVLLTGCSQHGPPAEQPTKSAVSRGKDDARRIAKMTEGGRNAVFGRALEDAQLECQTVKRSVAAGAYQGMPVWTVFCDDSGPWTLVIGKDGTAQILDTNQAQLVRHNQKLV